MRLISLLHARKMDAEDVRHWYRYPDWFLPLPTELEQRVWQEVRRQEEERKMPFITFAERNGREEGHKEGRKADQQVALRALGVGLRLKFGEAGAAFLSELEGPADLDALDAVSAGIESAASLDDLRKLLPADGPPSAP